MIYDIEHTVLFDSDLNILTHIETEECISLTMSQSLLLEIILNSESKILSRDTIIDELWHNYGVSSSVHTLNQYISLLRKLFVHFGVQDVIVTLPRVGLRLNPDIDVKVTINKHEFSQVPLSEHTESTESTESIQNGNQKVHKRLKNKIVMAFYSIVVAGLVIYFLVKMTSYNFDDVAFYTEEGCEIGFPAHTTSDDRALFFTQIKEILKENFLTCNKSRVVYFYFNKAIAGKDYGRSIMAFCTKGDNQRIISCENYYYRNWRVE